MKKIQKSRPPLNRYTNVSEEDYNEYRKAHETYRPMFSHDSIADENSWEDFNFIKENGKFKIKTSLIKDLKQ